MANITARSYFERPFSAGDRFGPSEAVPSLSPPIRDDRTNHAGRNTEARLASAQTYRFILLSNSPLALRP